MSKIRFSRRWGWIIGVVGLVLLLVGMIRGNAAALYDNPSFTIVAVTKDTNATIQGQGFPPNTDFVVTFGAMGTRGVGGSWVAMLNSGTGSFTAVIPIPTGWRGATQIAVRLENLWSGHFAYNWFYNSTATVPVNNPPPIVAVTPVVPPLATVPATAVPATAVPATPVPPTPTAAPPPATTVPNPNAGYSGIPACSVQAVVRDTSVTIQGSNFPRQIAFTVRMGSFGTQPYPGGGFAAATFNSGDVSTFTQTFNLPTEVKGLSRVGIRIESSAAANSFNCYAWFYNSTAP